MSRAARLRAAGESEDLVWSPDSQTVSWSVVSLPLKAF